MSTAKTGGCLCEAIRYEIAPGTEPIYNVVCHCKNCKKISGSQIFCASIFPKDAFKLTAGTPKEHADYATDSGKPLLRHFCGNCGSSVYASTSLIDAIVSVFAGGIDDADEWWTPNKEQYIGSKCHWIPDIMLQPKENIPERHDRGPREL